MLGACPWVASRQQQVLSSLSWNPSREAPRCPWSQPWQLFLLQASSPALVALWASSQRFSSGGWSSPEQDRWGWSPLNVSLSWSSSMWWASVDAMPYYVLGSVLRGRVSINATRPGSRSLFIQVRNAPPLVGQALGLFFISPSWFFEHGFFPKILAG